MNDKFLVSVIVPVYNGQAFLGAAIDSVLAQTYAALEIIVVDDGSTDDTAKIVASFGQQVRYVYQPNAGPAVARNHGVTLARGELLAFLDADDWWQPQKLQRQVDLLVQPPAVGYAVSHMRVQQEGGTVWPAALNQAHYQNEPPCFLPSALVVRRTIFEEVGGFDKRYRYSDDADWFLRAKDAGIPFAVVPEPLIYKRIHATNLSHTPAMAHETLRAVHASVQRQRQSRMKATVSRA